LHCTGREMREVGGGEKERVEEESDTGKKGGRDA
jgi:hypothetical protein